MIEKKLMRLLFLLFLFSVYSTEVFSQTDNELFKFKVTFTDKANTPYHTSDPHFFLSQRAIERRSKFNIPVTELDLPVDPAYIDSVAAKGVMVEASSKWFNAVLIETEDSASAMNLLSLPFVQSIDLVYYQHSGMKRKVREEKGFQGFANTDEMLRLIERFRNDNKRLSQQSINYGAALAQVKMTGVDYLHHRGFTGDSIEIAVLDAGFTMVDSMAAFDSLRIQNRILSTRNFVEPGETVYKSSLHGTYVLSTMAANQPGVIVGTAPHASYHLLLTEDIMSEYPVEEFYWALGAEYADSVGADMINSSLGYTTFDLPLLSYTMDDMDGKTSISARAATHAAARGMIVVTAAGNGGGSLWFYICSPADADSIVTVGAVNVSAEYAHFSSTGPTADSRIKPTVAAVGLGSAIASTSNGFLFGNGTSFATPIMCGAIACLWQANPNIENMTVIDAVIRSANQYNFPDTLLGYGIPNLSIANLILAGEDIPDLDRDKKFKIVPNPFHDHLQITFFSADTQQIFLEIFNLQGKLLFSKTDLALKGMNSINLYDLNRLSSGLYIVRIVTGRNIMTEKIIKR